MGALGEEGQSHPGRVLRVGNVALDLESRELNVNGVVCVLTPKQCKLLGVFMTSPGEVLTRKHLIKQVWETDYVGDTRTLDVHVRWLREKLGDTVHPHRFIQTVRRVGYRFCDPRENVQ
ncbi:MAG: winged helix-turn-helix domain-containing protein [Anaerolineae bacterium]